jgi:hypothetical protein
MKDSHISSIDTLDVNEDELVNRYGRGSVELMSSKSSNDGVFISCSQLKEASYSPKSPDFN